MENRKRLLHWGAWFYFANIVLASIISLRYLPYLSFTQQGKLPFAEEAIIWIFIALAGLGQISLLIFSSYLLIIVPVTLMLPHQRFIKLLSVLVVTLNLLVLIVDTHVYALYRYHLSGVIWQMVLGGEGGQIFYFSSMEWLILAVIVVVMLMVESWLAYYIGRYWLAPKRHYYGVWLTGFFGSCLVISWVIFLGSVANHYRAISDASEAIPFYNDVITSLLPQENAYFALEHTKQRYIVQPQLLNHPLQYPLQALQCQLPHKLYNVVVIVIDTWRFDMLTAAVMPHVFRFAQQSWNFTHHMSGGNATRPGMFSLFYSIPASYWTAMFLQQQGPVFIHKLLQLGYQMAIYASAELTMPAFNKTIFREVPDLQTHTAGAEPYDRDRVITQKFADFLQKQMTTPKQPFFAFLFYDAAHAIVFPPDFKAPFHPWWRQVNHWQLNNNFDATAYLNRYKNALYFIDGLVGKDLQLLADKKVLQDTIVIITGDHGEEFNDNRRNYWGHSSNFTRYQLQTPLIIYWPGQGKAVFSHITTHYDVLPYLLKSAFGCNNDLREYSVAEPLTIPHQLSFYMAASYIAQAVVEPDRTTVIYPGGRYVVYAPDARVLPNASWRTAIMSQAFEQMTRFFHIQK